MQPSYKDTKKINFFLFSLYKRYISERSDTKPNVKLDGFRSQLQASYVSSHTEEL